MLVGVQRRSSKECIGKNNKTNSHKRSVYTKQYFIEAEILIEAEKFELASLRLLAAFMELQMLTINALSTFIDWTREKNVPKYWGLHTVTTLTLLYAVIARVECARARVTVNGKLPADVLQSPPSCLRRRSVPSRLYYSKYTALDASCLVQPIKVVLLDFVFTLFLVMNAQEHDKRRLFSNGSANWSPLLVQSLARLKWLRWVYELSKSSYAFAIEVNKVMQFLA